MFWPKQYPSATSLWLPLLLSLLYTQNASTFVVPQELPTLLSLVYSNIPPIKKGTDSRLGFGFRLGENADFQVLLELGPQKETKPVGEPSKDDQSFSKRQVTATEQKALLRQQYRQQLKEEAERLMTSTERNGSTWLESWSNGMKPQKPKAKGSARRPPVEESQVSHNLPQQPQVPENAMQQLQQLYKMATSSSTTTAPPPSHTGSVPSATSSTTTTAPPPSYTSSCVPSGFKLPPPALEQDSNSLSNIDPAARRSQTQITKELMDVSLETEA